MLMHEMYTYAWQDKASLLASQWCTSMHRLTTVCISQKPISFSQHVCELQLISNGFAVGDSGLSDGAYMPA